MYVSGGLIMNIIGFCKIKKRAKICEVSFPNLNRSVKRYLVRNVHCQRIYIHRSSNCFACIPCTRIVLTFSTISILLWTLEKLVKVGLHYIILSKMYNEMQKMSNLTCQKEAINELSKLMNSPVDPLNDDWPTQPFRHEDDTFSDMIFALVIWLCIMFLTVLNVIVAIIEIKRWVWSPAVRLHSATDIKALEISCRCWNFYQKLYLANIG